MKLSFIDYQGKSCGLCGIALEGYGVDCPYRGKQDISTVCMAELLGEQLIKPKSSVFIAYLFVKEANILGNGQMGTPRPYRIFIKSLFKTCISHDF
jgi:hypothetical protein